VVSSVHTLPAFGRVGVPRQERPVEVLMAVRNADDLDQVSRGNADVSSCARLQAVLNFAQREQVVVPAASRKASTSLTNARGLGQQRSQLQRGCQAWYCPTRSSPQDPAKHLILVGPRTGGSAPQQQHA